MDVHRKGGIMDLEDEGFFDRNPLLGNFFDFDHDGKLSAGDILGVGTTALFINAILESDKDDSDSDSDSKQGFPFAF